MHRPAIGSIVRAVREAVLEQPGSVPPAALLLLVREYIRTADEEIGGALGPALGARLAFDAGLPDEADRAAWLQVFVESLACTDDERVRSAADRIAHGIAEGWPSRRPIAPTMEEISACVHATSVLPARNDLLQAALDELERIVGGAYVPGEGLTSGASRDRTACGMFDYAQSAIALLAAYGSTGRLPYSMLAEELVQAMRRRWWDASAGLFVDPATDLFASNCLAASLLCRLAVLQGNVEYSAAAIVAPGANYAEDADRVIDGLSGLAGPPSLAAAPYAIAAAEWIGNDC